MNNHIAYKLRDLEGRLASLEGGLGSADAPAQQTLESIPGVRQNKWYRVAISFDAGDTTARFDSAEITPAGPFVITQCMPYWRITDTTAANFFNATVAPTGRTLPCTALPNVVNGLAWSTTGAPAAATASLGDIFDGTTPDNAAVLSDFPEFDFQIEIQGSGRYLTNDPIPAAAFFGQQGAPSYMGVQGWVERSDRLVVHANPTVATPHAGTVVFIFQGYEILGDVNIRDWVAGHGRG